MFIKILNKASVDCCDQLCSADEAASHNLVSRFLDKSLHFEYFATIVNAFDKNKTVFPKSRRKIEFPVGRRVPFLIFLPVLIPEDPHVYVASFNFVEIDLIGPSVNGG